MPNSMARRMDATGAARRPVVPCHTAGREDADQVALDRRQRHDQRGKSDDVGEELVPVLHHACRSDPIGEWRQEDSKAYVNTIMALVRTKNSASN